MCEIVHTADRSTCRPMPIHACRRGLHVYPSLRVEITRRNRPACPRRPIAAGMARSATRKRPCVYPGHFLVCVGVSRSKCREPSETAASVGCSSSPNVGNHFSPRSAPSRQGVSSPEGRELKPEPLPPQNITSRRVAVPATVKGRYYGPVGARPIVWASPPGIHPAWPSAGNCVQPKSRDDRCPRSLLLNDRSARDPGCRHPVPVEAAVSPAHDTACRVSITRRALHPQRQTY